eukprot:4824319-Amphidinium_carterae.1
MWFTGCWRYFRARRRLCATVATQALHNIPQPWAALEARRQGALFEVLSMHADVTSGWLVQNPSSCRTALGRKLG